MKSIMIKSKIPAVNSSCFATFLVTGNIFSVIFKKFSGKGYVASKAYKPWLANVNAVTIFKGKISCLKSKPVFISYNRISGV